MSENMFTVSSCTTYLTLSSPEPTKLDDEAMLEDQEIYPEDGIDE